MCYEDVPMPPQSSCTRKMRSSKYAIVGKPSIARIFPYKKQNVAGSVSTNAKFGIPMNMIGGSQRIHSNGA
ncbi:hypothetical protein SFRURICE_020687 [Spodoptera frugiperda]|nr:hypothetical protein SFRURICE_020687 [Spodoptera frugiperda]